MPQRRRHSVPQKWASKERRDCTRAVTDGQGKRDKRLTTCYRLCACIWLTKKNNPPIPSRHRLWLELQRYLIVFEPPTFVLNENILGKCFCSCLSSINPSIQFTPLIGLLLSFLSILLDLTKIRKRWSRVTVVVGISIFIVKAFRICFQKTAVKSIVWFLCLHSMTCRQFTESWVIRSEIPIWNSLPPSVLREPSLKQLQRFKTEAYKYSLKSNWIWATQAYP